MNNNEQINYPPSNYPSSNYPSSNYNDNNNNAFIILLVVFFFFFARFWWEYQWNQYNNRNNNNINETLLNDPHHNQNNNEIRNQNRNIEKKEIKFTNGLYIKECTICLEHFNENELLYELSCNHSYHKECIDDWLSKKNTCPLCRLNLI